MFLREIEGFIAVVAYCCHRYCMAIKADIMLAFRRARAKIFSSFRACFQQHAQPIPGYPSETHVWKVNSRSKMQQAKHA
eukprot:scaffold11593_cov162-Skeletonema_dohrnii-CCMP3373.AAC.1